MELPFVTSDHGIHSHKRYHMSAPLNADVTLDDGPYSIMLTHHHLVRHA